ncbi:TetR/AcrR family transcriptional regulator [Bordetella genomosp. 11]|uniref:TetR family transcriptional regulator n=1 Tax=Bordetella genomosp. 11 TaxID=1416808 RepID=A0A261UK86_9BORD|nr:TetR/AcrR family transcriptional regulator [Bordetella genomosp. 11]OZI61947.1 TetR family transcriptional regulator [Bordetella genomosp. 11]
MPRTVAERQDVIPVLVEVFRRYGYEGTSLSRITEGTGLGKGSLYHFFPGGKDEMAAAVLAHIDDWFQRNIYAPLREAPSPRDGIAAMFDKVSAYFLSGRKACLVGVFALGNERDRFAQAVSSYFRAWAAAVTAVLEKGGVPPAPARDLAEEIVGGIQGALVLARAWNDPQVYCRMAGGLRERVLRTLPEPEPAAPPPR